MFIFDSVQKKRVLFTSIKKNIVKFYVCGPTVYDDAHLGHGRSAVVFDVFRRVLKNSGYKVIFVRNFTDIDDKIIKKLETQNKTLQELTEFYINSYLNDMDALNVQQGDFQPKATNYIDSMVNFIKILLKKDIAYIVPNGDIYFDTSKDKKYLSISKKFQNDKDKKSRLTKIEDNRRNINDFILWKNIKDNEKIFFNTEFGQGRPGWHIECSAMIEDTLAYKDELFSIDIHGGGADLIFPHHENEATQSRCATNRELAKYWLHNGFVKIDGEKMSKSLGNSFFIKDALKHYHGEVLRFYLLSTHYRQDFNFSEEGLLNSKKRLDKLYRLKQRVFNVKIGEIDPVFKENLLNSVYDDLNISKSLSIIDEMINFSNEKLDKNNKKIKKTIVANIEYISNILGFGGLDPYKYFQFGIDRDIVIKIESLIQDRNLAKQEKNFSKADKIRDEIESLGVDIMDTPIGTVWAKKW
jgi:cysteinyl-tRNA synthetase